MTLVWTLKARQDLDAIFDYILQDRPSAAAAICNTIDEKVKMLLRHPGAGRPGRIPGTRELVIAGTPFLVPYRVKQERVELLRVLHAARGKPWMS